MFGMKHYLVNLYQVCSIYAAGAKMALPLVPPGTWPAFNKYLYVSFKQNSGERFRAFWSSYLEVSLANSVEQDQTSLFGAISDLSPYMYMYFACKLNC